MIYIGNFACCLLFYCKQDPFECFIPFFNNGSVFITICNLGKGLPLIDVSLFYNGERFYNLLSYFDYFIICIVLRVTLALQVLFSPSPKKVSVDGT